RFTLLTKLFRTLRLRGPVLLLVPDTHASPEFACGCPCPGYPPDRVIRRYAAAHIRSVDCPASLSHLYRKTYLSPSAAASGPANPSRDTGDEASIAPGGCSPAAGLEENIRRWKSRS